MLLTRLPAGRLADPVPTLAQARWAFPLVGLVVGALAWAVHAGALAVGLSPLVAAVAALATAALVTGGLHLDGLADFADGIGGGRDRAHCLEIMRDSRIGSYGVLALVFATALAVAALAGIAGGAPPEVFLLAATTSRLAMLVLLDRLPPVRPDGLGSRAAGAAPLAWVPGALVVAGLVLWTGPGALAALAAAALAALIVARLALRRIGGQTGDVLGAAQVLAETAAILALSAWAAA
jgi:adenosylcobinamide-GDP ribazoletransferase